MSRKFFFHAAGIIMIIFSACTKDLPTASFTHSSDNYEAGDTINFTSTSSNADNFNWEFGDGGASSEENPWHIFNSTGTYEVNLEVTNEDGSDKTASSVTIKDPTILAFQVIKEGTEEPISGCGIFVFDNQTDWDNVENPVAVGLTDIDGYIEFYHAKAIVYYLYAYKEETGGVWYFAGYTGTLLLNQMNGYTIPAVWEADKKAAGIKSGVSKFTKFAH